MKPTYEELVQIVEGLRQDNTELRKDNAELRAVIARLVARLNQSSKNSSKPPSSDQKQNKEPPSGGARKSYHSGKDRKLLPDHMVTSRDTRQTQQCPRCCSLMTPTGDSRKWQQIDLPNIKPLVHEIELVTSKCSCCALVHTPTLAEHEQFLMGPRFEGFVSLLMSQFRQGHRVVCQFIELLMPGVQLSQGLISKAKSRAAIALDSAHCALWEEVCKSVASKYADCTGWRHCGKNYHALLVRTQSVLCYSLVPKQNGVVLRDILGPDRHHLVSDRGLPTQLLSLASQQYCLAHLLRNIQGIAEHPEVSMEETQALGSVHEAIQGLFRDRHRVENGDITAATGRQYGYQKWAWMRETVEELLEGTLSKSLRRFCKKALKDWKLFMTYLAREGPMTNNLAEEGLRHLVIARKLCFGSRSAYGLKWREAVHSCVETLRRRGKSILDFFSEAIQAMRTGSPYPTIV